MTELRQQAASLLVCGFEDTTLPLNYRETLKSLGLGGIILFARNYVDSNQIKRLTEEISGTAVSKVLIAVDQEGGRVVRFGGDFPVFASPLHYGLCDDLQGLLHATQITAEYLKAAGVNLNLVPVCDLAPQDSKHVIHSRSYSSDPEKNAIAVARQVEVLKHAGVLSCAKHFPGLASAYGDPHFEISRSDQTLSRFHQGDYLPFQAAISAGVDMVMPTHLLAPAFDEKNIVTFSRTTIHNELKQHLQFEGIVISDDLLMAGSLTGSSPAEAGVKAIKAGSDLLIYGNLNNPSDLIDQIAHAAQSDPELAAAISTSSKRISDFKEKNPILAAHESATS